MAARKPSINKAERELIEELRKHPEMFERFQEIMRVASEPSGDPLKTADQVEEMLIEEMRRLGKCTMENWAMNAESKVAQELKADHPKVQQRKKKTLKWYCVFGLVQVRERIWRHAQATYVRALATR